MTSTQSHHVRASSTRPTTTMSWDDAEFIETIIGNACVIDVGDADNPKRPMVALIKFPPGMTIPVHFHGTDYVSIVAKGEIMVGSTVHQEGSVRVVKAGTGYGPLVAGPQGCNVIEIFADRSGIAATYPKTDDPLSQKFIALQNELMAKVVGEASS